jgi:hypothetical protein
VLPTHSPGIIAYVACAAVALTPHVAAQSPAALAGQLPSLSQVLDQHIRAIGGERAVATSGSLLLKGACDSSGQDESGPIEILVNSPKVVYDLNGGGLRMGYDGESVWRAASPEGLQQRKGRQFAELVTVFDPVRARWWKDWYPQMAVAGVRKIDGRDVFVLETLPGSPSTERLFIDRGSGLLVRDEVARQFVFTFSDYRPVGGVMTAFAIRETTPNGIKYTYRFDSIEPAVSVDESRFRPRESK